MKKLRDKTFLIEGPMDLSVAIDQAFADMVTEPVRGPHYVEHIEVPDHYPYVAVIDVIEEYDVIVVNGVSVKDFVATGAEGRTCLFEFNVRKTWLESPYKVRENVYQMPAKDLIEAIFKMGQTHHKDEEYLFEILSWNQVR